MSNHVDEGHKRQALLAELVRRIDSIEWSPPVTLGDAERLLRRLPARGEAESLIDWNNRVLRSRRLPRPTARIIPFRLPAAVRVRVMGTVVARAAAEVEGAEPKLPTELTHDCFRLTYQAEGGRIQVFLEVLGPELLNLVVGTVVHVTGPDGRDQVLQTVRLDAQGEARFDLDDRPEVRTWLQNVTVYLL